VSNKENGERQQDCPAALRALAQGRLDEWPGLQPTCHREHVQEAFGPSLSAVDSFGQLGGSPTAYRRYSSTPGAPLGLITWFVEDQVVLVRIQDPVLGRSLEEMLGAPEAVEPSRLRAYHNQWIYAGRGLVAHVSKGDGMVSWLYGFRPSTTAEFLDSWLCRVERRRFRRR